MTLSAMRRKLFVPWAAFRWVLLMFLVAPAVEAPLIAVMGEPAKPLRVWTAVASWYGSDFEGRLTANGETFDPDALTAAHPHLPFGSKLRVVYPKTGRSQVVRVNDRGPFVEGRGLDLSYEAARRLGIRDRGVVRLRVELLEVPKRR